jgi:RNA recognition motif-containing protein
LIDIPVGHCSVTIGPRSTQDQLQALFEAHGEVISVNVITDRYSGRSRGFAFVEMATEQAANAAIAALNG